jgi:sugar O-acyltransferase (sialic acid O-acetyltransferase NeuD family)
MRRANLKRTKVVLYGASGHGRVVADILRTRQDIEHVGYVDDDRAKMQILVGQKPVFGNAGVLARLFESGVRAAIVTIGENATRERKATILQELGFELEVAIHPDTTIVPGTTIGAGTVIMAGVVINPGAKIGRNVILNTGATVDHDCTLEDAVHLSPGVHLGGSVWIGRRVHVGIGANIIQGIRVGDESIVGAGAVVIRNVDIGQTVVGNPARELYVTSRS